VRGGLVVDESAFDTERWHPAWGTRSARADHAPVGAFTVNYGAFAVEALAGAESGDPVRVVVDPPVPYLRLTNRAITGPPRAGLSLAVERSAGPDHERVNVSGSMPAGSGRKTYYRSVLDPVGYAAAVLRMQLEANGIAVEGETRRAVVPGSAVPLLTFDGHPMAEIVRLFLKYSNNAIAESLVKALGARATGGRGSWRSGIPALKQALAEAGLATEGMTIADGSGLSYDNRVSPRQMVSALRLAGASFRFGPEFVASLPIAAGDGTLEKRAAEAASAVRGKTGLLTRVTALSGFAELADGTQVVFSVIVNGFRSNAERAMDAIDGFVSALTAASRSPEPESPDGSGAWGAAGSGAAHPVRRVGFQDQRRIDRGQGDAAMQAAVDVARSPVVGGEGQGRAAVAVGQLLQVGHPEADVYDGVEQGLGAAPVDAFPGGELFAGGGKDLHEPHGADRRYGEGVVAALHVDHRQHEGRIDAVAARLQGDRSRHCRDLGLGHAGLLPRSEVGGHRGRDSSVRRDGLGLRRGHRDGRCDRCRGGCRNRGESFGPRWCQRAREPEQGDADERVHGVVRHDGTGSGRSQQRQTHAGDRVQIVDHGDAGPRRDEAEESELGGVGNALRGDEEGNGAQGDGAVEEQSRDEPHGSEQPFCDRIGLGHLPALQGGAQAQVRRPVIRCGQQYDQKRQCSHELPPQAASFAAIRQ
jgi:PBP4 family serine-type D-alanyl-D-alanine carboxypeptidase